MKSAVQSNAIVSSLFPSSVRDRLFPTDQASGNTKTKIETNKLRLKTFLSDTKGTQENSSNMNSTRDESSSPIADLFPHCTVIFSDIAGFTAWSSVREPAQVFTLLESLYGAFDSIAIKRGVFKVETIGDAYVAVVGLPEPRDDHAVVMTKFARDCNIRMVGLVHDLETNLGPGTSDLRLRFGLHSGAVTAGVLRGQKSRFQLFGDTVNTASRMESTGLPNRIQASNATAELLIEAGKASWVKPREELVHAKGKGTIQTYWIEPTLTGNAAANVSESSPGNSEEDLDGKTRRLVDWNTDVLSRLLKHIQSRRRASKKTKKGKEGAPVSSIGSSDGALDEVKEVIEFPIYDAAVAAQEEDPESIELDKDVEKELRSYVVTICMLYNANCKWTQIQMMSICWNLQPPVVKTNRIHGFFSLS
jgi:class 3 adenylate cyclase